MKFSLNPSTVSVLHFNAKLPAAKDKVFKAFTTPDSIRSWWLGEGAKSITARSDPKTEGEFYLEYKTPSGSAVTQEGEWRSVSDEMLILNLGPDSLHKTERGTLVSIELRKDPDGGGTLLSITQEGLEDGAAQKRQLKEWLARVDRLKSSVR